MKEPSTKESIFVLIWFPVLIALSSIYHGFVLTKLWGWFVVPTFSLPLLSLPAAIGLSLIIGFMAKNHDLKRDDESNSLGKLMLKATLKAAAVPSNSLLFGYIVSRYM